MASNGVGDRDSGRSRSRRAIRVARACPSRSTEATPSSGTKLHGGVIVAYAAIDHIERDLLGRLRIHLRGHGDVLPVSRACAGLFKQM
ncbi:hypothetical protein GR157_11140 [Burkholderia sp. 4701]|nr:hypothetical protein [Burkholderia sp. 4701]MXN82519.1 hypothetical protein [Burkholderia sp. 4812]